MPPRKKTAPAPPPLTDTDVAALKSRVHAGEKPRVVVRTASAAVPAGTRGNIVRIGNPSEGEYVVVRLGKDEVPFAPAELSLGARAAKAVAAAASTKAAAAPTRKTTTKPAPARPAPAKQAAKPAKARPAAPAPKPTTPPRPAARKAASKKSRPSRRTLPPLVVTLRFNDGGWTVEAARGARRLAKASAVRPGAVKAFADLVDEATVREALTETIESCRSVVEERAATLRAELVAAEAALREYDARRR